MFEGLDDIPWGDLVHAYGPATDIPDQIRALGSDDEETQLSALYSFTSTIWHQGTVYSSTAYAVPFIVQLLKMPSFSKKYDVLDLLGRLAHGYSYIDVHQQIEWVYTQEYRQSEQFQQDLATELSWVQAAHDAVARYHDIYLQLLTDDDARTRSMAIVLLGALPTVREVVLPRLQSHMDSETSDSVKATILMTLPSLLPPQEQSSIDYLSVYLDDNQTPILRFSAAQAITRVARDQTPQEALTVLVEGLTDSEDLDRAYNALYQADEDIQAAVGRTLCYAGPVVARPILPRLIETLPALDFISSTIAAEALMYLLFAGSTIPEKGSALDLLQHQALTAIGKYALQFNSEHGTSINGDVGNLLYEYGLPGNPADLETYLNQ